MMCIGNRVNYEWLLAYYIYIYQDIIAAETICNSMQMCIMICSETHSYTIYASSNIAIFQ